MTTSDPLYWGLILVMGSIGGIFAFHLDRQDKQQMGLPYVAVYVAVSVFGAAFGAHFVGPILQIAADFLLYPATAQIQWPAPVSMQSVYLFIGTVFGATLFNTAIRLLSRDTERR